VLKLAQGAIITGAGHGLIITNTKTVRNSGYNWTVDMCTDNNNFEQKEEIKS
jgi:hypothetical protein